MPAIIHIDLTTNAAGIVRDLERFPAAMMSAIAAAMDLQNELTVGEIVAHKLSRRGPKTLGVVTNRLRTSLRRTAAIVREREIDSSIGSNVKYAGVHEFGFKGRVNVREHRRKNPMLDVLSLHGETLLGWQRTSDHARAKRIATGISRVRAHPREMNIPERAYIRGTIQERAPKYTEAISAAILSAWQGGAA